jgi:hypothetical protein
MGHPTDIFIQRPPDGAICTICHDVVKNAVISKECGHSFCEGCSDSLVEKNHGCATCRFPKPTFGPNHLARDVIGDYDVHCPQREINQESNTRRRGNDGNAVPAESCAWTGKCEELANHKNVCDYELITCERQGCEHRCYRKDMDSHLSRDHEEDNEANTGYHIEEENGKQVIVIVDA